jgi:hypothetical protein
MAEIEKIAVYDPRIIQEPARYAVQQGALSVSTAQFQATSATSSQLSFQVLVPSLNVFIDRKIELNTGVTVYSEVVPSQSIIGIVPTAGTTYPDNSVITNKVVVASVSNNTKDLVQTSSQLPFIPVTSQTTTTNLTFCANTGYVLETGSFPNQGVPTFGAAAGTASGTTTTGGDPAFVGWLSNGNPILTGEYVYQPIGIPQDLYPTMFPVQSLCNSMTVTVNDCSISLVGDTLKEQLLLAQTRDSIQQRTCPSKFDIYANGQDDALSLNGNGQGYGGARDSDIPNGSWPITFVNPSTGAPLPRFGQYVFNGVAVPVINWRPAIIPALSGLMNVQLPPGSTQYKGMTVYGATDVSQPLPIMFRLNTVEPLAISPFLWQDSKQMSEVGLYGITNMTVSMNLNNPGASVAYDTLPAALNPINTNTNAGTQTTPFINYFDRFTNSLNSYSYLTRQAGIFGLYGNTKLIPSAQALATQNGPWIAPRLFCTFLTPPPNTPLPLVSCVPYVEFPRYTSSSVGSFSDPGRVSVSTNTITLSSIPDVLVIFAKASFRGQTQYDTYIPISQVSVNFDNYSNLCSNYSQEDLYACSVAAGLDMDFSQFRGYARSNTGTFIPTISPFLTNSGFNSIFDQRVQPSPYKQLTGSPVLLRMGQDIPLSSGLAPGTLGNYSVQVNLTLDNTNGFFGWLDKIPSPANVSVTIMGVNSGFFESCKGSSAIRKTILNTVDVESVSASTSVTATQLQRLVGGSGVRTSAGLTNTMAIPRFMPGSSTASMDERPRKYGRTMGSMIS